jgi:hypothetical protein
MIYQDHRTIPTTSNDRLKRPGQNVHPPYILHFFPLTESFLFSAGY